MKKNEKIEVVQGSGNVFRDFGDPNADTEQLKCILAARIIDILDKRKLSVRKAEGVTGVKASEFSLIRNVKLGRFTADRLISILNKFDQQVDVKVKVRPRSRKTAREEAALRSLRGQAAS